MEETQLIFSLLRTHSWGGDGARVAQFLASPYCEALERAVQELQLDALYQSPIHGVGHILRTMVHGAMGAMEEGLSQSDTTLLLEGCAYHDVGRRNDSMDDCHGERSAAQLAALTGRRGRELAVLQAAVTLHSLPDRRFPQVLEQYGLSWDAEAEEIALLLKDADGLDRVRIWDLDPRYLRCSGSAERVGFAKALYLAWQKSTGGQLVPDFVRTWKGLDGEGNPVPWQVPPNSESFSTQF